MQIVATRTLQFKVKGQPDFVLRPSPRPVSAPEHIRSTKLFQLALKDGSIQEFIPKADAADAAKAAADADAKAKAAADAKAQADADAAKAAAEAKVATEIESAKADLAKNDKKAK